MVKSMTGFGRAELVKEQREYQIEIKSVNHKYNDICVKLPRNISFLEEDIKKYISKQIKRGKVDVSVTFSDHSREGNKIQINQEIAKIYIDNLKKLAQEENLNNNIEVIDIAKLPDVLTIKKIENEDVLRKEMLEVLITAMEKLIQMRTFEGNKMAEDILARTNKIKQIVHKISELSTGLIQEYVVKLESRIKELLKTQDIDQSRLAQEVVIYADKCSIEEEITRLYSHILQIDNLLKQDGPIGKKLDFIIQEMNRETNTIGSKSNSLEITNGVIEIKTELENIREQVQNIE